MCYSDFNSIFYTDEPDSSRAEATEANYVTTESTTEKITTDSLSTYEWITGPYSHVNFYLNISVKELGIYFRS